RHVDDLLEAERVDVEVDRTIRVGDRDADAADLGEIELGLHLRHLEPPTRRIRLLDARSAKNSSLRRTPPIGSRDCDDATLGLWLRAVNALKGTSRAEARSSPPTGSSRRWLVQRPKKWRGPESNRRHHGFQPCAL